MEKENRFIEPGTPQPDKKYHIQILPDGPYLVYGNPEIQQEILAVNEEEIPWEYVKGNRYPTTENPTALCRCGQSGKHPYCDGSHAHATWEPALTAENVPLLKNATFIDGPTVQLADNPDYCARARICMAKNTVWRNAKHPNNAEATEIAVHETVFCPSGRLKIRKSDEENYIEPDLKPEIGLIEDPQKECSGPLWVKGGIPIDSLGTAYEQRNRVTLCRCGASTNKPFCDGTHIDIRFNDHLPQTPEAKPE